MRLIAVLGLALASSWVTAAQLPIGFIAPDEEPRYTNLLLGLRQGLQKASPAGGDVAIFEHRVPRRDAGAVRRATESLHSQGVKVVFVVGTELTRLIRDVSKTLPIVFITPGDPVRTGVATSLAQPGNNLTGMTFEFPELSGKRLEMLKEINPAARVVGVVYDPQDESPRQGFAAAKAAAKQLGLQLIEIDIEGLRKGRTASTVPGKLDAMLLIPGGGISTVTESAIKLALSMRIGTAVWARSAATQEALLSYGVNDVEIARDAARLVMRIVHGHPAGNLPIERPIRFELSVNLRTAKALGISIPPEIMVRADRVIQ